MNKKIRICILIALLVTFVFAVNCYAVTEAEVQSAVDSSSKESVSGNLFVYF